MNNAHNMLSPETCAQLKRLLEVKQELLKLEEEEKALSSTIKNTMTALNIKDCDMDDTHFAIVQSERKTVSKATKDTFIKELVAMNKKHLIKIAMEPDVDGIFEEINAGTLDKDFVGKYVKVTPVVTLRTTTN